MAIDKREMFLHLDIRHLSGVILISIWGIKVSQIITEPVPNNYGNVAGTSDQLCQLTGQSVAADDIPLNGIHTGLYLQRPTEACGPSSPSQSIRNSTCVVDRAPTLSLTMA